MAICRLKFPSSIVGHGESGFVYRDRNEFETFARKIEGDPGAAGKERVASRYSIEGWADTIAGILHEAASPGARHQRGSVQTTKISMIGAINVLGLSMTVGGTLI